MTCSANSNPCSSCRTYVDFWDDLLNAECVKGTICVAALAVIPVSGILCSSVCAVGLRHLCLKETFVHSGLFVLRFSGRKSLYFEL